MDWEKRRKIKGGLTTSPPLSALLRKFYRQKHAVHVIGVAFRHYKLRKYLQRVVDTFSGVKRMKDYGKHLTWPAPPPAIEDFVEALKRMHRR